MSEPSDSKRLPRNAAPIPCPNSVEALSPTFDSFVGSLPNGSPSLYSEFDVVLDDGTLQKRTVSLSTLPDDMDNLDDDEIDETVNNDQKKPR
jgi:hypothetical protein